MLFLGSIVLWGFVFAWHNQYSGRSVVMLRVPPAPFGWATAGGLAMAGLLRVWLDPMLRARTPEEYPLTVQQWVAVTLFSLAFTQLFLVFAPFAWVLRLVRRQTLTVILTVLFGVYVLVVKNYSSPKPMSAELWLALLVVRLVVGLCSVLCFLRGACCWHGGGISCSKVDTCLRWTMGPKFKPIYNPEEAGSGKQRKSAGAVSLGLHRFHQ